MRNLNLANPAESEIEYRISKFPDGQQDIMVSPLKVTGPVTIKSRFNSFRDLELIICATKSLRRLGTKEIHLYIPYLLGARSDRQFQYGGTSYLVDVVAPIINSMNFESVTVVDVHSDVAPACINKLKIISNETLAKSSIAISGDYVLVSPDAGALKKIYGLAKALKYEGEIIVANKHRDLVSGNITHTEVPNIDHNLNKDFVIIDDICDGGRTFIEMAKIIKARAGFSGKIYLIVTHGIFSQGLHELAKYFDGIHTTNSIMDISSLDEFGIRNERYLDKISQINVF